MKNLSTLLLSKILQCKILKEILKRLRFTFLQRNQMKGLLRLPKLSDFLIFKEKVKSVLKISNNVVSEFKQIQMKNSQFMFLIICFKKGNKNQAIIIFAEFVKKKEEILILTKLFFKELDRKTNQQIVRKIQIILVSNKLSKNKEMNGQEIKLFKIQKTRLKNLEQGRT